MSKIAIIILAAGSSSRLGQPKQLLRYKNTTLIAHAVEAAVEARRGPVIIVTGALNEELLAELNDNQATVVHNTQWEQGMSSSIRAGVNAAEEQGADAVLIMLCDQPLVSAGHIKNLCTIFINLDKDPIITTGYNNISGVPAVFSKKYFEKLKGLQGEHGARELLRLHQHHLVTLPFTPAALDIDSWDEYEKLRTHDQ